MRKRIPTLLIFAMLLLSNVFIITIIPIVSAAGTFEDIETFYGICGQKIWVNSSGWNSDPREYVQVWFAPNMTGHGTGESPTDDDNYIIRARADSVGGLNVSFNIPYRSAIGEYNVSLYGEDSMTWANFSFNITDIYKVQVVPDIIYWDDTESQNLTINIYNWTGSSYNLLTENIRYILSDPNWMHLLNDTMDLGTITIDAMFDWNETGCHYCGEANYTLIITTTEAPYTLLADIWVPVRFHLIDFSPTTATYMDEETIIGRFIDGGDDYIIGFEYVQIVSPMGGVYYEPVITSSTGLFTFAVTFNVTGFWHVGTWIDGKSYRPTDKYTTKGVPYFITYQGIDVEPQIGTITVDPNEEVYGFNVTFEILCEGADGDAIADAWIYVTGVNCSYAGVGYNNNDYVMLGQSNPTGWLNITLADMLKFNDSGTAKFLFTYDKEWNVYEADDDLEPLIYAETLIDIAPPSAMNVFANYIGADKVLLGYVPHGLAADPSDPPASGLTDPETWGNWSSYLQVTVYGINDSLRKNATIIISGCGLDIEFDEDNDLWNEYPGNYSFLISPRNGGILTISAVNETSGINITEEIDIDGLVSNSITSIGGDKEIIFNTEESINFTVNNASYAEVHANLYDEEWNYIKMLNWTVGDNTEDNGKNGVYKFQPEVDTLGYIVLSAMVGYNTTEGLKTFYSYDIIDSVNLSSNNPPNAASHPNPSNHATDVDINIDLSWIGSDPDCGDPLTYDIYFGTSNNPPLVSADQSNNSYDPGILSYNTKYYWKIITEDSRGATTSGPIWDFITGNTPNNPPYTPSNPNPLNNATSVEVNINLSWIGGDPDYGDNVTYDIYFGNILPLQKIGGNISTTIYNPGILTNNFTYYWYIIAWDNHGVSTIGPEWKFTTLKTTTNKPPNKPNKPRGLKSGRIGTTYSYSTSTTDPDNDNVYYWFDWGDGTNSGWEGPYYSGDNVTLAHFWVTQGNFPIKVKAKDIYGNETVWSDPLVITMPKTYINIPIIQLLLRIFQRFSFIVNILNQILSIN